MRRCRLFLPCRDIPAGLCTQYARAASAPNAYCLVKGTRNHPEIFDGEPGSVEFWFKRGAFKRPNRCSSAYHGLDSVPVSRSPAKRLALQSIVEM